MYTDIVNLQSFDQACELCYVAKKYMMPHLVKICTEYLWKDLNEENACRAFEFGRLFEEPILMDKSMLVNKNYYFQLYLFYDSMCFLLSP